MLIAIGFCSFFFDHILLTKTTGGTFQSAPDGQSASGEVGCGQKKSINRLQLGNF